VTKQLIKFWCRADIFICGAGIIGDVLLVIGLITAALNTNISGFTPLIWILLAFILYVVMILCAVLRIMDRLESRQ
jgi:membrane protein implicated in regulation of membrane protease activity